MRGGIAICWDSTLTDMIAITYIISGLGKKMVGKKKMLTLFLPRHFFAHTAE